MQEIMNVCGDAGMCIPLVCFIAHRNGVVCEMACVIRFITLYNNKKMK